MDRSEVVNYLNTTISRVNIDMADVFAIRNFIHLKHNKLISPEQITNDINARADPFVHRHGQPPFNVGRAIENFRNNLKIHFSIIELFNNQGKIIKYV
jgi:hypothetical protein